jgi:hypothetical protein
MSAAWNASIASAAVDEGDGATEKEPVAPATFAPGPAATPIGAAWSPIVVAGVVRMAEFLLIIAAGLAIYIGYLVPIEGFEWRYVGAIFGVAKVGAADDCESTILRVRRSSIMRPEPNDSRPFLERVYPRWWWSHVGATRRRDRPRARLGSSHRR